jgi:hypothetical protein
MLRKNDYALVHTASANENRWSAFCFTLLTPCSAGKQAKKALLGMSKKEREMVVAGLSNGSSSNWSAKKLREGKEVHVLHASICVCTSFCVSIQTCRMIIKFLAQHRSPRARRKPS